MKELGHSLKGKYTIELMNTSMKRHALSVCDSAIQTHTPAEGEILSRVRENFVFVA